MVPDQPTSDHFLTSTATADVHTRLSLRAQLALSLGSAASWLSQKAGRGKGAMIGGLVSLAVEPKLLAQLGAGRRTVLITGTNGKSTTTRMTATALAALGAVTTQSDGANMDAGIAAALASHRHAPFAALEVDELHLLNIATVLHPEVIVLLNLTRDQLDRVGEINMIERKLRQTIVENPQATVIANCDDVLVTSAAWDAKKVVWVAAGAGWAGDAASCPRTGDPILWEGEHWRNTSGDFYRPEPDWWFDEQYLYGTDGQQFRLELSLPGQANRGNAAEAVAAAVAMGVSGTSAAQAVREVKQIAGRYQTVQLGHHQVHVLLAKNPAGWQEALSMIDRDADGLVIAVNGQVPDGEDLSWLWDVRFEHFQNMPVIAAGERGTDLAVRLTYAEVEHQLKHDPLQAIRACPPGKVEVLANYTAFRDLHRALEKQVTQSNE